VANDALPAWITARRPADMIGRLMRGPLFRVLSDPGFLRLLSRTRSQPDACGLAAIMIVVFVAHGIRRRGSGSLMASSLNLRCCGGVAPG
jgi:hypothetical protein